MIKDMKREGILLIFVVVFVITFCSTVTAHPGHGVPEEVPSDPGTGSTDTTITGTVSPTTTSTATGTRSPKSTQTGYSTTNNFQSFSTASQNEVGTPPAADNSKVEVSEVNSDASTNSPGGPAALVGLIIVFGLIIYSFPFKGVLGRFQEVFVGK